MIIQGLIDEIMNRRTLLQGQGLAGAGPLWSGLVRSLREEHAYAPRVEGRAPQLFERGLLDGDWVRPSQLGMHEHLGSQSLVRDIGGTGEEVACES